MKYIENIDNALYLIKEKDGTTTEQKITNYGLEAIGVVQRILSTKNKYEVEEELILKLTKEKEPSVHYLKIIKGSDEEEVKSFIKPIHSGVVGLIDNFNKESFSLTKEMLNANLKKVKLYKNFGHQFADPFFVFGNKIYDYRTSSLIDYPNISNHFYLTEAEKLQILPTGGIVPIYSENPTPEKIMSEFLTKLVLVFNDSPVLVAIGVCIGILFFDLFIQYAQGFPYIILYGESNSGKSTLLYCLASVFGMNEPTKITSGVSTMVAIREGLSSQNNIPLFIEEIDKSKMERIEELGKQTFSATPRKKSSKDGTLIVTDVNTTFFATTNYLFENMTIANFTRSILINMPRGRFDLENFEYHSLEKREPLSSFVPKILSYRNEVMIRYNEEFKKASQYSQFSRVCNNVAIGMTMWSIFNSILGFKLVDTEKLAKEYFEYFEPYLETEIKYGDIFLSDIYKLFISKDLIYGRDFLITRNQTLRVNLSKYCLIYNGLNEKSKTNPSQLRLKLKDDSRFIDLKGSDCKPIGKAIRVDISDNDLLLGIKDRVRQVGTEMEEENE